MTARPNLQMMITVHHAFERDIDRLSAALAQHPGDATRVGALAANWTLFYTLLEHHHQAEDQALWPTLLDSLASSGEVVAQMEDEHHQLDGTLIQTHQEMLAWAADPTPELAEQAAVGMAAIRDLLTSHLRHEEEVALPLIESSMTADEFAIYTNRVMELNANIEWTMPWVLEGLPDPVRASMWNMIPKPLRDGPLLSWCDSYSANLDAAFGIAPPIRPPV